MRCIGIPIFLAESVPSVPGLTPEETRRFRETQRRAQEAIKEQLKIDYTRATRPLSFSEIYAARNKPQSRSR